MGIRSKLLILLSALVALALLGVAMGVTELHRRECFQEFRNRQALLLSAVGAAAGAYATRNDLEAVTALIRRISDEEGEVRELAVLDGQGRFIAHSDPARLGAPASDAFSALALRSTETAFRSEADQLRIAVPVLLGERRGAVTALYSTQTISAAIARIRLMSLAFAAAMGTLLGAVLLAQKKNLERVVAERTRELREANVQLQKLAVTDGLTGVFNHRRFQEAIEQETLRSARSGRPFSLLFLDVDHFKRFNDSMGHPAGDKLLCQLAALLQRELRSSDLVARHGGEEFAVILAETATDVALQVAERLRAAVELELNDTALAPDITVSVGAATYGFDGETAQELLLAADRALYLAKQAGRNRVMSAGLMLRAELLLHNAG